jgi:hypothetical protein
MTDAVLVRSHVVDDPVEVFTRALEERLTGHAVVEPQDAFLLGDGAAARVAFDAGVPVGVVETAGDRDGPAAVETLVGPGPYAVETYRRPDGAPSSVEGAVPPDLPARRLGDDDLAARTRAAAPGDAAASTDPVTAFLDDEAAVESIRAAAREEAVADADEWGLTDHLDGPANESAGVSDDADG